MLNLCRSMRHWVAPNSGRCDCRPPRAGVRRRSPTACRCCWPLATGRWWRHAGWRGPSVGVVENTLRTMGVPSEAGDGMARSVHRPQSLRGGRTDVRAAFVSQDSDAAAIFICQSSAKLGHRAITSQVSLRPRSNRASGWRLWASPMGQQRRLHLQEPGAFSPIVATTTGRISRLRVDRVTR